METITIIGLSVALAVLYAIVIYVIYESNQKIKTLEIAIKKQEHYISKINASCNDNLQTSVNLGKQTIELLKKLQ